MSFWSPDNLRAAMGGMWVARPEGVEPGGAGIDSRTIRHGQVFFALGGERTDGHRHVADAARAGASMAVVEDPARVQGALPEGFGVLRVPSARRALGKLAAAYRRTLEGTRVIAVTGSNGKTTTTRLIDAVLRTTLRGTCPRQSYNNDLGVPLTILGASRGDQYLVCEVGMNAPGEIAALGAMVSPDVGVVTSVGRAHLERLGTLRAVAQEKASLLGCLRPGGLGVVHADAPDLLDAVRALDLPGNVVTFGSGAPADVRVTEVETGEAGTSFTLNGRWRLRVPLLGAHNALNAAAAVAVARRLRVPDEEIARGLAGATGAAMRLERSCVAGVTVLNDAYNANPDSMLAAVRTLVSLGAGREGSPPRRVAILGDMLEQGAGAEEVHREVAQALAGAPGRGVDLAVLVGRWMRHAADVLRERWGGARVVHLPDVEGEGADRAAALLRPGDLVLLKGSRRMGLERVALALAARGPHRALGVTPDAGSAAADARSEACPAT